MDMTPIAASAFAGLLERATGQLLVAGRRWRIEAALGPLMRTHGIDSLDRLAAEVGRDRESALAHNVVEALLNNETFFFRDAAACRPAHEAGIAALIAARAEKKRLRIWSAGCSTGQEIYSFAMGLAKSAAKLADWDVMLLGTDVSRAALAQARGGLYSQMEVQRGLPILELITHFDQEGDNWRVKPSLRARTTFVHHNLFAPAPAGPFDLILCRNVLLYFVPERRRQVLANLADAIAPDGLLILGAGETVLGSSDAFVADEEHRGLYRKAPASALS